MPAGDIYQLNVDQTLHGQELTNVHYFRQESADPPTSPAQALIDAFASELAPKQADFCSDEWRIVGYRAIRIHPMPTQAHFFTSTVVGQLALPAQPANVCFVSSMYGTPGAKIRHSRNYYAGLTNFSVVEGLLVQATLVIIRIFLDRLLQNITDATTSTDWKRVLWDTATDTAHDIIDSVPKTATRKLRSRTKGQGS